MGHGPEEFPVSEDSNNARDVEQAPESTKTATPEAVRPAPPPRRGGGVAWLALLLALGVAGWQGWVWWQDSRDDVAADEARAGTQRLEGKLAQLESRLQALESAQSRLHDETGSLRTRLGDGERVNRSLREEVLGIGERAVLLEDAVARLAERRLEGQAALRLDEAESLLRMAYERQRLFHDRDGALAALRLADATLAAVESAQLVNLRQTLRREIAELASTADVDRPALARRLHDLRGIVARLPEADPLAAADADEPVAPSLADRLGSALSKLISVRRIGPEAEFERFPAEARRAAVALEIELLRSSLATRDDEGWRRGCERVSHLLAGGFDEAAPALATAREIVTELSAATLVPQAAAPEMTLRELRNLRAMRSLVRDVVPAATGRSAAEPRPAPGVDADEDDDEGQFELEDDDDAPGVPFDEDEDEA
jgi:uroporphyrin-III C-methyltransferase